MHFQNTESITKEAFIMWGAFWVLSLKISFFFFFYCYMIHICVTRDDGKFGKQQLNMKRQYPLPARDIIWPFTRLQKMRPQRKNFENKTNMQNNASADEPVKMPDFVIFFQPSGGKPDWDWGLSLSLHDGAAVACYQPDTHQGRVTIILLMMILIHMQHHLF